MVIPHVQCKIGNSPSIKTKIFIEWVNIASNNSFISKSKNCFRTSAQLPGLLNKINVVHIKSFTMRSKKSIGHTIDRGKGKSYKNGIMFRSNTYVIILQPLPQ